MAPRKSVRKTVARKIPAAEIANETAAVQLHPAFAEIRYNGESVASERLPNGANGSDAAEQTQTKIAALEEDFDVTVSNFDAQGNSADEAVEAEGSET